MTMLTAGELVACMAPYRDPRGGHRCPLCAAPIRVITRPTRLVGCPDAPGLERLAATAVNRRTA